jgi:mannitol/fructose-specific phosphotransferase system IIA component (Ntr-type)
MNTKSEPHFYQYLAEGNIICGLHAENGFEAISELTRNLTKNTAGLDFDEIVEAVNAREKIIPTVVAPGLAVPHARMDNIDRLIVALGTSIKGVDFQAKGAQPVNVVILILTPKDDPGLHLQVLAALAKDFKNPETVRKLAAMEAPADVLKFFSEVKLPDYLRAKDVMNSSPVTLQESDTLHTVIETFATQNVYDIPVIDEDNDLRGRVSVENILKLSLPEHILWMNDLTPIQKFQPFAEMIRDENETKLADFMTEEIVSVDEDIPAIQLAKIFAMENARQIIVTREGKLAGVVNIKGFITKLFWA